MGDIGGRGVVGPDGLAGLFSHNDSMVLRISMQSYGLTSESMH